MAALALNPLRWYRGLDRARKQTLWVAITLLALLLGFTYVYRSIAKPYRGKAASYKRSYDKGNRKNLPTRYFSQIYEWYAAKINIGICAALLLSCPWWMRWARKARRAPKKIEEPKDRKLSRAGILMLLAALILGATLRAPRMTSAIYLDEQDNLRRSIHGYYDTRVDGAPLWKGATWEDTFFENRLANSPVFHGILARACADIHRAATGAPFDTISIFALRIPSFVAGLACIVLLWGFVRRLGYPGAATFAAFLFALHPESIKYGTQARGYALMMMFVIIALWSAYNAIETGRWRHWVLFGLAMFLTMYSYTGAVYFLMAINLVLFAWLAFRWLGKKSERAPGLLTQLCVTAVFTAIVGIQAMLPVVVQAQRFFKDGWYETELRAEWVFDAWNGYTTGTDLPPIDEWWNAYSHDERPGIHTYIFGEYLRDEFSLFLIALVISPALLAFALYVLWRQKRTAAVLAVAGLLAPVLAFSHHKFITGLWIHTWYLIYFLPVFVVLFSIGLTQLPCLIRAIPERRRTVVTAGACAAFLGWFSYVAMIKPGKGRLHWNKSEWSRPAVFVRGKGLWKVEPNGRSTVEDAPKS